MSQCILVIEPDMHTRSILVEVFVSYSVVAVATAAEALEKANNHNVQLVIMELSLAGHSGMEFLFEYRTYADWQHVPVIVYSGIALDDTVQRSRSWQQLDVSEYLYKPDTTLLKLKNTVDRLLTI